MHDETLYSFSVGKVINELCRKKEIGETKINKNGRQCAISITKSILHKKTRINNTKVQRKFYLRLCTVSMKKSKRKLNQN